ncbi:ferredoxin [Streptomyces sp. Li-HN-5-11]|uniref:ferredoxin n=1 Tax=Streptomyces sp. Li-HN-5-11 TaxID=3075432 RepID=UPI0028AB9400|nr:ferredoxin [Streptomyces sp. Li-HN-5-11]WNM31930.1 ferredoxin [Streptomyces sp. Li-HN-5-11]
MKVVIDEDRCRGHAVCCTICPEVFDLNDDGYAVADTADLPPRFEQAARTAATSCPERAITLS